MATQSRHRPSAPASESYDELGTDLIVVIARYPVRSALIAVVVMAALAIHQLALGPL